MSGYLINLGSGELDRLPLYVTSGVYGTRIPRDGWYRPTLYTLADFLTMRPGDLIFFFQKRTIYGIGSVTSFDVGGEQTCTLSNYPSSFIPNTPPVPPYLWDGDSDPFVRFRVFFKHEPKFYQVGVDMDEVLQSDVSGKARSLPVFSNRSFIQMEDDETELVATAILRRNSGSSLYFEDHSLSTVDRIAKLPNLALFKIDADQLVRADLVGDQVAHEPTLQAWLVDALTRRPHHAAETLGKWDFVCNLYPASPLKPRVYMDEIDIFGYETVPRTGPLPSYIAKFRIIEVKAGVQGLGPQNAVDQTMKYVDWVSSTRAGGDYSLVSAYIVARGFTGDLLDYARASRVRNYVIPRRPYETRCWQDLHLIAYHPSGHASPALNLATVLGPAH